MSNLTRASWERNRMKGQFAYIKGFANQASKGRMLLEEEKATLKEIQILCSKVLDKWKNYNDFKDAYLNEDTVF